MKPSPPSPLPPTHHTHPGEGRLHPPQEPRAGTSSVLLAGLVVLFSAIGCSSPDSAITDPVAADLVITNGRVYTFAWGEPTADTLDFLEGVLAEHPDAKRQRHRIEHAQVIHPDDFARFAPSDIIASMEPPHAVEDKTWADKEHQPPAGWYPEQSMTPEEAVRAYTSWSAYAAHWEEKTGVLTPGRWADLTLMDVDPLVLGETDPGTILDGKLVATIVAGEVVYRAAGLLGTGAR